VFVVDDGFGDCVTLGPFSIKDLGFVIAFRDIFAVNLVFLFNFV
jgi:hypothetical protein